jgi:hypothetical protein
MKKRARGWQGTQIITILILSAVFPLGYVIFYTPDITERRYSA